MFRTSVTGAAILWVIVSVVLLASPDLQTTLRARLRLLVRGRPPAAASLPLPVETDRDTAISTAIRIDGDLSDWPREGVRSEVAGAPTRFPTDAYPYIVSLFADQNFLYIGWDFPNDVTDCRRGRGSNDLTSVKFGRSGDAASFMVNGLLHVCELDPAWNYPDQGALDGYHARWLVEDRDAPWDREWGLRWVSGPFPRGIQARTDFGSGHRVTEWAVPLSLLGVTPCETIALNIFTGHDRNGTLYADASGGRPWIHDMTTLQTVVPCAERCQESWDCTEWTLPTPAGLQTRACVDVSGCRNRRLLPPELRRAPSR